MATLLAAALTVLSACAFQPRGDEAPLDSGVFGHVVVDAGCPPAPHQKTCPDQPMAARLTVTRTDTGGEVATVETESDGTFRIPLDPGSYVLTPANLAGAPMPSSHPISVEVRDHEFSEVSVRFDSGVR